MSERTSPTLRIGEILDRKYRLVRLIGEGGMGAVYEAEHVKLGGRVAVKVLLGRLANRRDVVKRFIQEARAASSIGHPGIAQVIDLGGLDTRTPYMVMELLRGANLSKLMQFHGPLNPETVACVLGDVLSALHAAHEIQIVHRDLKPDNIFVARDEAEGVIAKVVDFGISKITNVDIGLTQTGTVMGTPMYMSPEQARGVRSLDRRVDIYACGVIAYEALCGEAPFSAENYNALLQQIVAAPIEPIRKRRSDVGVELEAVVFKALARDRDERYETALEFAEALREALDLDGAALKHARVGLVAALNALPGDVPSWRQDEVSTATDLLALPKPERTGTDPAAVSPREPPKSPETTAERLSSVPPLTTETGEHLELGEDDILIVDDVEPRPSELPLDPPSASTRWPPPSSVSSAARGGGDDTMQQTSPPATDEETGPKISVPSRKRSYQSFVPPRDISLDPPSRSRRDSVRTFVPPPADTTRTEMPPHKGEKKKG